MAPIVGSLGRDVLLFLLVDALALLAAVRISRGIASPIRRLHREAGFAGHFVKPVDMGVLEQRVREWLGAAPARHASDGPERALALDSRMPGGL